MGLQLASADDVIREDLLRGEQGIGAVVREEADPDGLLISAQCGDGEGLQGHCCSCCWIWMRLAMMRL